MDIRRRNSWIPDLGSSQLPEAWGLTGQRIIIKRGKYNLPCSRGEQEDLAREQYPEDSWKSGRIGGGEEQGSDGGGEKR